MILSALGGGTGALIGAGVTAGLRGWRRRRRRRTLPVEFRGTPDEFHHRPQQAIGQEGTFDCRSPLFHAR
jgi:hypothetical protein